MKKLVITLFLILVTQLYFADSVLAQSASNSASTSASSSNSASASDSSLPKTLPKTGAADVMVLLGAGIIFLFAGITSAFGTHKVFTEIE